MTSSHTDVLIVGAGPTGVTLAIDLLRRGISVRIVDREPRAFEGSRAKGVQPRTMEIFDDLGVVGDIVDEGGLYPPMGIHLGPVTVPKRMMAKPVVSPAIPYPDTWLIPQDRTTAVLHNRFRDLGGVIGLGTELSSYTSTPDEVTAELSGPRGPETVTCRFLVGADGGSSRVRKGSLIDFVGTTDDTDRMLIVDAAIDGASLSRSYWHVWPGLRGRFVGACPLPHTDLFQWMIRLSRDEEPPQDLDEIIERIRRQTRLSTLRLTDVTWRSVFRPNIRLAERYRHGRVLLAGDAAHVHTPAGAQGMNTGIGDACNLGWKLAQVLSGADDALLDTYEEERRPIAAAVLGLSTTKYEGMGKLDPSSLRRGTDEQQLTLSYHGGPLAPVSTATGTGSVKVGDRAPDVRLNTVDGAPTRLFDILRGPHFTALAVGPDAELALATLAWPSAHAELHRVAVRTDVATPRDGSLATTVVDRSTSVAITYGLSDNAIVVIRPDGYVGHIATADAMVSITAAVRTLTGAPAA